MKPTEHNGAAAYRNALQALPSLPGLELVEQGFDDLMHHRVTCEALLLSRFTTRLARADLPLPASLKDPDQRLYELLAAAEGDNAHGAYNALTRRLVSFLRAAERARSG